MSSLAYGALTRKREEAEPKKSTDAEPPGVKTYIDTLAALVPAEVLAAHAVIIDATTTTTKNEAGQDVTTITDPTTLKWVFWALIVLSAMLYLFGHTKERLGQADIIRALIPPAAFVLWMMLQKTTAFDAIANPSDGARVAIGVIGALLVGSIAAALASKADGSAAGSK